ncbi:MULTISPECIES: ureidoglycolate lyase [Microbacterium]|uniref:ureidoglycolate lyase n=1 Tax=Microbacterium TaxID=33882 RepID=UPI0027815D95|nr:MULTISPECIES: ureidoglycolate lyase [Microbacterium]MDQ1082617.1 ureidoglycolate hydrolase [Microbacterium sp. SORGH_AS_0344]MDQ1168612.1 ureidoglycolate hydrolase [Microbacterium proteolyticum]
MPETLTPHRLTSEIVSPEAFEPYGVTLTPMKDGTPFTAEEAVLDVSNGIPRFYLMHLEDKPAEFVRVTRHLETTQTLLSVGDVEWTIAVAAPGIDEPTLDDLRAFRIPPRTAITLRKGTWHAGPFFAEPSMDFVNLELDDTNVIDHHNHRLDDAYGVRVVIDAQ